MDLKRDLLFLCFLTFCLISSAAKAELEFGMQTWSDDNGEQDELGSLTSNIRILSLFYTDCPNTCNLTIAKFQELEKVLLNRRIAADFVLMSLDPKNDTPSVLKDYRTERDLLQKNWHFLSSTEQQVVAVAKKLGYEFTRLDDHVFHRMKLFVLDTDNNVIDVIKMSTDVEKLKSLSQNIE